MNISSCIMRPELGVDQSDKWTVSSLYFCDEVRDSRRAGVCYRLYVCSRYREARSNASVSGYWNCNILCLVGFVLVSMLCCQILVRCLVWQTSEVYSLSNLMDAVLFRHFSCYAQYVLLRIWRTPPTAHSNRFQLFHDSGR
jgi:hypothetical protein